VAPGGPGTVGEIPTVQAIEWLGDDQTCVCRRQKRKIEYTDEDPEKNHTTGQKLEMCLEHAGPAFWSHSGLALAHRSRAAGLSAPHSQTGFFSLNNPMRTRTHAD
jgi:hypothetical protein